MVYFFSNKSCVPLLKLCYFILNLGSHAKQKIMSIVFIFVDYFVTAVWITGTVTLVTLTSDGCFPPDVFAGQVWCNPRGKSKPPGNRRPRRSWCETSPSRPQSKNCENSSGEFCFTFNGRLFHVYITQIIYAFGNVWRVFFTNKNDYDNNMVLDMVPW